MSDRQSYGVAVPPSWRQVASHPDYFVSDLGDVRHHRDGATPLKGSLDRYGYRRVCLNGKTRKVHRLVCTAFHGPCPDGLECAHLDGDASNNAASNLRWVTHKENVAHSIQQGTFTGLRALSRGQKRKRNHRGFNNPRAIFNVEQVEQIVAARKVGGSYRAIGRTFNCNASTVCKIVKRYSDGT